MTASALRLEHSFSCEKVNSSVIHPSLLPFIILEEHC